MVFFFFFFNSLIFLLNIGYIFPFLHKDSKFWLYTGCCRCLVVETVDFAKFFQLFSYYLLALISLKYPTLQYKSGSFKDVKGVYTQIWETFSLTLFSECLSPLFHLVLTLSSYSSRWYTADSYWTSRHLAWLLRVAFKEKSAYMIIPPITTPLFKDHFFPNL